MSDFPNREIDILALGQDMTAGMKAHPEFFGNSPIALDMLLQLQAAANATREAATDAQALSTAATAAKQDALEKFANAIKIVGRFFTATLTAQQLGLIGYPSRAQPTPLQVPAQPRSLQSLRHGDGALNLDWKPALNGGKPANYLVERRELPDGEWQQIATVFAITVDLDAQPRAKPLEYRVFAANRVGSSEASNTLSVML